jgi:tRNA threonylcarbamoyladenosine biosynthesis protein TsaE
VVIASSARAFSFERRRGFYLPGKLADYLLPASISALMKHTSHSLEETAQIAHGWLASISKKKLTNEATVVGLSGHLGAGKTAFTKCIAKEFGIAEDVTSPTFVIMKIYPVDSAKNFPWKKLVHIDAYRFERAQELESIDFEKYAADPDNLILIEWPENVKEMVENLEGYSQIHFSAGDGDTERVVEF